MYYNPNTHLELMRMRQADLEREAERDRLARLVQKQKRPSLLARMQATLRRREAAGKPAPSAC